MSEAVWTGTQQLSDNACGNCFRIYFCCSDPDKYSVTNKSLLIESEDGGCKGCLCGKTQHKDNTLLTNIRDVDIVKVQPGCIKQLFTCCMASSKEIVTVKTSGNSGNEEKILWLGTGKAEAVAQILQRD